MSMSWFVPSSSLSNVILNGAPAGASSFATLNFTSLATTVRPPGGGPPEPGAPDAPGDPPGAGDPPAVSLAADFGGNQPWVNTTPTRSRMPIAQNRRFGHVGAGSFPRWPVVSASTVWRYSLPASSSQPSRGMIVKTTPNSRIQPGNTSPRNRNPRPSA